MSPEQASGDLSRVGPRSDVYGLGAILYEILTGEPPYRGTRDEVIRRVVNEPLVPPAHRAPGVAKALDAVCRKCLEKDPAERYATVGDLAKDVQRYLADEPVTAYEEPLSVRIRRLASRHRTFSIAAAATTLVATICLAVAAAFLNTAARRESEARREAVTNFRLALDAVERSFTRIGDDRRLKAHGLETLRRDLLLEAKNFYEGLLRDERHAPWVGAELGRSYLLLARITEQLGQSAEAVRLSEAATATFERLLGATPTRRRTWRAWPGPSGPWARTWTTRDGRPRPGRLSSGRSGPGNGCRAHIPGLPSIVTASRWRWTDWRASSASR